jgi:hypothetical protein
MWYVNMSRPVLLTRYPSVENAIDIRTHASSKRITMRQGQFQTSSMRYYSGPSSIKGDYRIPSMERFRFVDSREDLQMFYLRSINKNSRLIFTNRIRHYFFLMKCTSIKPPLSFLILLKSSSVAV